MSIIHDALKKVQMSFKNNSESEENQEAPKKPFSFLNLFFSLILLLACLLFGYAQLQKHWDKLRISFDLPNIPLKKIELPQLTLTNPKDPAAKPVKEIKPPVPLAKIHTANSDDPVNIQGILTQNGKTVALINDKIYEEGDEIGQIKILSIDTMGITILKDGQEETVRVHR